MFPKKLLSLLAAVLLILSGCSKSKEPQTAKKILRIADNMPNLITPGQWNGQTMSLLAGVYDSLVELDPQSGELAPYLAAEWSSDDGMIWTVSLRPDVKFHDGSGFDSQDVRYTVERTQDETLGHILKENFSVVESIETPDALTVRFILKEPRPLFMYSFLAYSMMMLSSEYDYSALGETAPMGTGPFTAKQIIPKESALLVKNPDYWRAGYPLTDEMHVYFVADAEARSSMLQSGAVDHARLINTAQAAALDEKPGFQSVIPYPEYRFISMAQDREPFNDPRVTLAFKLCMDPDVLAQSIQGRIGEGVFYSESPVPNALPQFASLPQRERDTDRARALLTEAGYPDGLTVPLHYASDHTYGRELAQTLKELAAEGGFTLELQGTPRDVYLTKSWMNVPLSLTGWSIRAEPAELLTVAFHSQGPWNEAHMNVPEIDSLIDSIKQELSAERRRRLYRELQMQFREQGALISLEVPLLHGSSDRLLNYENTETLDFMPDLERWDVTGTE